MSERQDSEKMPLDERLGVPALVMLSFWLLGAITLGIYAVVAFWPGASPTQGVAVPMATNVSFVPWGAPTHTTTYGTSILILASAAGLAGGALHAAASLIRYAPTDEEATGVTRAYVPKYLLLPAMGAGLAFVLHFALRGGVLVLSGGAMPTAEATVAVSGLAGLFARTTIHKLRDAYKGVFKSRDAATPPERGSARRALDETPKRLDITEGPDPLAGVKKPPHG